MEGIINYIALGCSALSLILDIVALAIPNWISQSPFHFGLWKYCVEDICVDIKDLYPIKGIPDFHKATQALLIIGLILVVVAIVMSVLKTFVMKDKVFLSIGAAISTIAGGVLSLIGAIVFAVKETEDDSIKSDMLSAGFALAIVAGAIAVIAGILFILGNNK